MVYTHRTLILPPLNSLWSLMNRASNTFQKFQGSVDRSWQISRNTGKPGENNVLLSQAGSVAALGFRRPWHRVLCVSSRIRLEASVWSNQQPGIRHGRFASSLQECVFAWCWEWEFPGSGAAEVIVTVTAISGRLSARVWRRSRCSFKDEQMRSNSR